MALKGPAKRCAVYTRKSSEEGLEQHFNSLQAQREACEAFVRSQKIEGWRLVETTYDDGGFSGGSMERPALRRLMEDIRARRIDVIVVYKIDRLTRSLADFAKMVEVFDAFGVSFVAVTQQFNTTTSMGRLTLNVLLSFAQFEREVTAERIRDKIAASKKKGMWMGGCVPLGYDVRERKLHVNVDEADTVRHIFQRYLALGSVRLLEADLAASGIRSKARMRRGTNEQVGRAVFSRGALYALLANPIYVGEIRHGEARYPGLHAPIIERPLWDRAQALLPNNGVSREDRPLASPSPLAGRIFDAAGERLTPTHTNKKGRRYRYYVSHSLVTGTATPQSGGWRIPGPDLERAVAQAAASLLSDRHAVSHALADAGYGIADVSAILQCAASLGQRLGPPDQAASLLPQVVRRVEVRDDGLNLTLSLGAVLPAEGAGPEHELPTLERSVPMRIRRRGIEMRLVLADAMSTNRVDPALIKVIARARAWWRELSNGAAPSIAAIAEQNHVTEGYVRHLLPLAFLAPSIVEDIVAGRQPAHLTAEALVKRLQLPVQWAQQRVLMDGV